MISHGWFAGTQSLHVLDVFGASRGMQRCWERQGLNGVALDILLGGVAHDILSREGFFTYVNYGLQMLAVCIIWFNVFFDLSWLEEMCPTMFLQTSLSLMCSLCILGCQGPCYQQGRPAVYMFGCQAALIAAKTMKTTGEMKLCSLWGCPTLWCATSFLDMIANFLRIEFDMFD